MGRGPVGGGRYPATPASSYGSCPHPGAEAIYQLLGAGRGLRARGGTGGRSLGWERRGQQHELRPWGGRGEAVGGGWLTLQDVQALLLERNYVRRVNLSSLGMKKKWVL